MLWIQIIFFIILISFALAALSIAPFVPTKRSDLERINTLAKLKEGQVFFEMGCGDGRVSHYIAEHNPKATAIGIEYCFPLFLYAKIKQLISPLPNLHIKFGNGFYQNLKNVDVAYVFWVPESMTWLQKKFETDLKSGAKILSYVCEMKKWNGSIIKDKPSSEVLSVYIHTKD